MGTETWYNRKNNRLRRKLGCYFGGGEEGLGYGGSGYLNSEELLDLLDDEILIWEGHGLETWVLVR